MLQNFFISKTYLLVEKVYTFCLFLLLGLGLNHAVSVAQTGKFYSKNYLPETYLASPQNWAIAQDKRGVMYFGNGGGVLEYDGVYWRSIPVSNNTIVRSLCIDDNGTVFVGTQADFGFLEPNDKGELVYKSLIESIKEKHRKFADVWQTFFANGAVFFRTSNKLFRYQNGNIKVWEPTNTFFRSYLVNGTIYMLDRGIGLKYMTDDSLRLLPGGEFFSNDRVYTILPYESEERLLVGTEKRGLYLINSAKQINNISGGLGASVLGQNSGDIMPFSTQADQILTFHSLYNGITLPSVKRGFQKQRYALATTSGGVIVIDSNGKLLQVLNKLSGVNDNMILNLFSDRQNALWLGMNKGISRVEVNSPITKFSEDYGLIGNVESITRHNTQLFVGTIQGVFYLDDNEIAFFPNRKLFKPVLGIASSGWDFYSCIDDEVLGNMLLAANSDGVYSITGNTAQLIRKGYAFTLYRSKQDPSRIFIGGQGISSIKFENGHWIDEGSFPGAIDEIRSIVETNDGDLWLGTSYKGLLRINFSKFKKGASESLLVSGAFQISKWGEKYIIEKYGAKQNLPSGPVWTVNIGSQLSISTPRGLYKYLKDQKIKFVPDSSLGALFAAGGRPAYPLVTDASGNVWLKSNEVITVGKSLQKGKYNWEVTPFLRIPKTISSKIAVIYPEDNGITWFGGHDGLIRMDDIIVKDYKVNFSALIRKVIIGKDSALFNGAYFDKLKGKNTTDLITPLRKIGYDQDASFVHELPYEFNSLTFEFAAPTFDNEKETHYQYVLEGFDNSWTDWTTKTDKEYTNLSERDYIFHVRARDIYGHVSREATYRFSVLPPWYRTFGAYMGYMLVLGLIIYSIVLYNSRRLKAENLRLENIITERTSEIVAEKEKVNKQNRIIEAKNKDITDSIKYAKRIQEAILPKEKDIYKAISNSFVLYKPKDIVSGDFYWFTEFKENGAQQCIIAAVDCTGHGVPGAFMSMIGNELLNQIVLEKNITEPGEVLNQLHAGVRFALGQYKEDAEVRDGMDIALCRINIEQGVLDYAGAHRPLYLITSDISKVTDEEVEMNKKLNLQEYLTFKEIKADKLSIGGLQLEDRRKFSNHKVKMPKDSMFYIFSDGYIDQFGGERNKKFMTRRFRNKLAEIQSLSVMDQRNALDEEIESWRGGTEQTDDIIVIGVKF
ncbi:SpoIIE family protein phosphatase [Sphingobacteriaceae bacterium AH-315-L07]|nr:SpoIIE family protein phosphatase [Sphingobacteriaceae bacterium AH-315-L07]